MKKPVAKIVQGGERLYLHPYAYDPKIYPEGENQNKTIWFYCSEFVPMNLSDVYSFDRYRFPWIQFYVRNILSNIKVSISQLKYLGFPIKNFIGHFKRGQFGYAFGNLWRALYFNYYLVYPTYGVEMAPIRLGLPYNLMVQECPGYLNQTENSYITPSAWHILMHLDWELEKIEAGTSELSEYSQDDLLQFEVWKRKMYEHGYEIRFMCELDT